MQNFAIILLSAFFIFSSTHGVHAQTNEDVYITIGKDSYVAQQKLTFNLVGIVNSATQVLAENAQKDVVLIKTNAQALPLIGSFNHEHFNRCAGFVAHDSYQAALQYLKKLDQVQKNASVHDSNSQSIPQRTFQYQRWQAPPRSPRNPGPTTPDHAEYSINQQQTLAPLLQELDQENIRQTILKLSSFNNRYFQSETGVQASQWLVEQLKNMSSHRNDVSIELFQHQKWLQPSVIATIKGSSPDMIIIGGHLDSINANSFNRVTAVAPGADDNASGIGTWLEVFRVLMENDYKPTHTIVFMGYAAEEVGLRGSSEIAQVYAAQKANIKGVVQLDMTNFKGDKNDIYLMTDYTNKDQNAFVGKLIDEYVKVPWGYDRCGYGCSDHASWYAQGYPASMPFESSMSNMNHNLHTPKDLIDVSGGVTTHALKFAKLALSFAVELDH